MTKNKDVMGSRLIWYHFVKIVTQKKFLEKKNIKNILIKLSKKDLNGEFGTRRNILKK